VNIFTMLLLNYRTCELFVLNNSEHLGPHIKPYNHIGDFEFGFRDGINTSLGIVAGLGDANNPADFVILAAVVRMLTGAEAMVVQNYLTIKSQEVLESEIKRDIFEMAVYPEKEREEIEEIYFAKEFDEDLSIALAISISSSFLIKAKLVKKNWVKGGNEKSVLGVGMTLLRYEIGAVLNNANSLISLQRN
jgi:vacuolar iron transporter family protein